MIGVTAYELPTRVATQRTSNFSNVGSENHPIKKVAITIDTSRSHTYTSCSCKEKVPINLKFAVDVAATGCAKYMRNNLNETVREIIVH